MKRNTTVPLQCTLGEMGRLLLHFAVIILTAIASFYFSKPLTDKNCYLIV